MTEELRALTSAELELLRIVAESIEPASVTVQALEHEAHRRAPKLVAGCGECLRSAREVLFYARSQPEGSIPSPAGS